MSKNDRFVVKHGSDWAVKRAGADRPERARRQSRAEEQAKGTSKCRQRRECEFKAATASGGTPTRWLLPATRSPTRQEALTTGENQMANDNKGRGNDNSGHGGGNSGPDGGGGNPGQSGGNDDIRYEDRHAERRVPRHVR